LSRGPALGLEPGHHGLCVHAPPLTSLRATFRRTRFSCSASQTTPIPPGRSHAGIGTGRCGQELRFLDSLCRVGRATVSSRSESIRRVFPNKPPSSSEAIEDSTSWRRSGSARPFRKAVCSSGSSSRAAVARRLTRCPRSLATLRFRLLSHCENTGVFRGLTLASRTKRRFRSSSFLYELRREDVYGDVPLELHISGTVDDPHPSMGYDVIDRGV